MDNMPNKNDGNSKAEDDCCQRTNASTRSIWEDQDSTFSPWSTQSSRTTQYTYSPYFNDIQNLLYSKPATYWNTSNTQESVFSPFYRTNDLEGGTWHRVPNNTDSYTWPNFANYNNNNQRKMRKETVYDLIDLAITYSKTLSQFLTSQEKLEVVHMAINKREVLMIDILIKYTKCCKCLLSFATKIRDIYQTMTIYEIFHAEQQTRNFVSNTSYYRIV